MHLSSIGKKCQQGLKMNMVELLPHHMLQFLRGKPRCTSQPAENQLSVGTFPVAGGATQITRIRRLKILSAIVGKKRLTWQTAPLEPFFLRDRLSFLRPT